MRGPRDLMLVMKFGGTSVGNAAAIRQTADILASHAGNGRVVAIVSAMSGITNALLATAEAAASGDSDTVDTSRAVLLAPHRSAPGINSIERLSNLHCKCCAHSLRSLVLGRRLGWRFAAVVCAD